MPNFFISDKNALGKQKVRADLILRNRTTKVVQYNPKNYNQKPILCCNYKPFLRTFTKGVHISLFYDAILSKVPKTNLRTTSAHNIPQILRAKRLFKPKYIMISPVFATKTHPDAKPLGAMKLFKMINLINGNFIALGGLNEKRYKLLKKLDFKNKLKGFAGIRNFLLTR